MINRPFLLGTRRDVEVKEWHCVLYGQVYGPFPEEKLRETIRKGELTGETLVWCGTFPEDAARGWIKAGDTEIAALLTDGANEARSPLPYPEPSVAFGEGGDERPLSFDYQWSKQPASSKAAVWQGEWLFPASRIRRFIAFVLDVLILIAFCVVFMAAPILLLRGESTHLAIRVFAATLGAFLIYGTINFGLLFRNGESVSKKIVGIRIANVDGSRTPFWRIIVLRNGVYIALFAALGYTAVASQGFLSDVTLPPDLGLQLSIALGVVFFLDSCLVFGNSRRTLHDRIAGTIVVEA